MQQGQLASRLSQLADVREAAEDSEQGIGATQTAALQQAYESVGKDLQASPVCRYEFNRTQKIPEKV